jgi:dTDP-glucose pyrophosphorylase
MVRNYTKNIVTVNLTIKDSLEKLNSLDSHDSLTLFVVDKDHKLTGTLTDGDIRRGLLNGSTLETSIEVILHRNFKYLQRNKFELSLIEEFRIKEIELIPLVDDDFRIIKILNLKVKKSILPIDAVIMAGGEGKRLRPLTLTTPKPLIKIGDKPILEHNIDRLSDFGIDNVFITLKHLSEQVENYFSNGDNKGITIKYIREESALGTIGALSLIENFIHDVVLVMNSDLLTNIDFEDLYRTFVAEKADMVVATAPYSIDIPYGVVETLGSQIKAIREKPRYTYYSNAGIYLIKKKMLDLIPKNSFFNATDLMEHCINKNLKVVNYPILGYWLDIGNPEDYAKAQKDIKHLKL